MNDDNERLPWGETKGLNRKRAKAFQDALQDLRRKYPDEFQALYEEHRQIQGLGPAKKKRNKNQ